MKSVFGSIRAEGRLDRISQIVRGFSVERQRDAAVRLDPRNGGAEASAEPQLKAIADLVKSELRDRFARGESPTVADYLGKYPELRNSKNRVISLIYEEYCLRKEAREEIGVDSFCDRYPEWKDSLVSQLQYHQLISQAAGLGSINPAYPNPGETFGEFDLISLLGTGGSSRVFIARDTSLGDREVVLKVAVDRGNEPMILGRLVHPRIVWVNSVSYQAETQLRGLSMPYHPGLPLDEILKEFESGSLPENARAFWDVLAGPGTADQSTASPGSKIFSNESVRSATRNVPDGDGWKGFPYLGTYAQGVAWIGRVLAEALHYAHSKDVFHRDIKPGNVLITRQQGPQLLDFNLAQSPHSAERAEDVLHGGTLPYMAPEQIRAFLDPACWGEVGAGADLYSLGLVLRELLTRRLPELPLENLPRPRALADFLASRESMDLSLRRDNPLVPYALEAIVARCLAFDPRDRYASAADLAADLASFLEFRPLKVAKNPSIRERVQNGVGRRRQLIEVMIAVVIGTATLTTHLPVEHFPAFGQAVQVYGQQRYAEAIPLFKNLADAYPDSPLPSLFLTLARNARGDDLPEVEERFRQTMNLPGAESTLINWAADHREVDLISGLDKFANRCFEDPKSYSERAEQAINLSLAINPARDERMVWYAAIEESKGRYASAYKIVSRRIGDLKGNKRLLIDPREYYPALFSRIRIAFQWSRQLLAQKDLESTQKVKEILNVAVADLDHLERIGIHNDDHKFKANYWRLMSVLTLLETDLEQSSIPDAKKRLDQVRLAFQQLQKLGKPIPDKDEIVQRIEESARRIQAAVATHREGDLSIALPTSFGFSGEHSRHP